MKGGSDGAEGHNQKGCLEEVLDVFDKTFAPISPYPCRVVCFAWADAEKLNVIAVLQKKIREIRQRELSRSGGATMLRNST